MNSNLLKKVLLLSVIIVLASSSKDIGRQATITGMRGPTKDKTFNLTAVTSQTITATHQLITVLVPEPNTGCSQIKPVVLESNYPLYYLVMGRDGGCTYANKVKWAKRSIARGLIIIDSEKGINNIRSKPNQKFHTYLMPEQQGDSIFNALRNEKDKSFTAMLNIGAPTEITPAEIWISSLNKQSYEVLQWFQQALIMIPELQARLNWRPRFAIVSNNKGRRDQFVSSCACDGMFCSPEYHGLTSHVLVREDIRQMLIFQEHKQKFLQYMRIFKQKCLQKYIKDKTAEDCSASILNRLSIDATSITQKIDKFLKGCTQQGEPLKLYQKLTLDRSKAKLIGKYPVVIINYDQVEVKNQVELEKAFCKKLQMNQDSSCKKIITKTSIFETIVTGIFWFIFVNILIIVGSGAVLYYRKKMRKEVNKELKMQVSTAVEHYYQLSENSQSGK